MRNLRSSNLRSAVALMAAAWLLLLALCPPMFRMDCLMTGRTAVSWYTPVICGPQQDTPVEHSVSAECCEYTTIAPAKTAYEPLALLVHHVVLLHLPMVLAVEPMLPNAVLAVRSYNGHGPPRAIAGDGQARLGVFRI